MIYCDTLDELMSNLRSQPCAGIFVLDYGNESLMEEFVYQMADYSSNEVWCYDALKIQRRSGETFIKACQRTRKEVPYAVIFVTDMDFYENSFILAVDKFVNRDELSKFIKSKFPLLDFKLPSESENSSNVKSYQKLNY